MSQFLSWAVAISTLIVAVMASVRMGLFVGKKRQEQAEKQILLMTYDEAVRLWSQNVRILPLARRLCLTAVTLEQCAGVYHKISELEIPDETDFVKELLEKWDPLAVYAVRLASREAIFRMQDDLRVGSQAYRLAEILSETSKTFDDFVETYDFCVYFPDLATRALVQAEVLVRGDDDREYLAGLLAELG